jgi:hypothetical protein
MALTDDLTFKLGDSGVILNADVGSYFVDIENVKGLDSAPFRTTERDHEGDDGGFMDAEFEKARDIVLDGTIYAPGSTMESYLDSLKENWAPSKTQVPFYFKAPGVNERLLFVKPLGMRYDWSSLRRTGQATVQFGAFAEDPRIYDSTLQTATLPLGATVFTGFGFNLGFSFGFGGVSSLNDAVEVVVGGNRPTPPVIRINGPIDNPRLISDTAGKEMLFSGLSLLAGEYVDVDMKNKTVKLNGTTNRRNTLVSPTWFFLEKGSNTLRLRASSSNPAATATVYYRSAWR